MRKNGRGQGLENSGKQRLGSNSAIQYNTGPNSATYTFSGLTPGKMYDFKGGAVGNGSGYTNRWTLVELTGGPTGHSRAQTRGAKPPAEHFGIQPI